MDDLLLSAIDQVPFILAVCEGPELRVLTLSAATRSVLPGREFRGLPIRDVISDLVGQQIVDAYYEVYRTGAPVNGEEWRVHLDQPDGSVLEMYANFTITPWVVDGERRGVVGVGFDVTDMVRKRVDEAAHLQRRYEQSRDVVNALQRELLPAGLPVLPGAQVAASYLLADADTAAGGDWFDAVPQPGGRVALTVGDVVGHGVTASGVMGQLRAVIQDRLSDGAGIVEALQAADRLAARVPAAHATTVCQVLFDPVSGAVTYCTAGHPPPLVISAGGRTRYLDGTGGAPLGTGGTFPVGVAHLEVGDVLLLYSDGILERPGRTYAASQAELARIAADSALGRALHESDATAAERVCGQAVELLVRATGHLDDITLLAVQRVPVAGALTLSLPARPVVLREARRALDGWLDGVGATEQDVFVLQHALGELMTNAIEHAFDGVAAGSVVDGSGPPVDGSASSGPSPDGGRGPKVTLRATLTPAGVIEATVTDQGRWREPERQPTRGRGLALTAQLVDSLRVEPGADGTVAQVRHTLVRPARLLDVHQHPAPTPTQTRKTPDEPEFRVLEQPGGHETDVLLEGPLDTTTAFQARQELLRRSRGGTVAMTVDLSAVTHLSSAGVSALHQVAEQHAEQKAALTLRAASGSPAQVVLEMVALDHLTPTTSV
ncbi:SpoIIE family protein phosphatase [Actinoplanes sp. TBRC 11911]|uniref:SpoIIE family protein phosphatase n=1 Tax=Actinoplanes sp. TBRC 11911 TaxID=2729386 RepID=UPI0020070E3E|nr:SpoIIE family protein phosphatase [Actinoplanes sp. TBRC 11911]